MSTGCKVDRKKWDQTKQRVKGDSPAAQSVNGRIELMLAKLRDIENELIRKGQPYNAQTLKDLFNGREEKEKGLLETYALFIEYKKEQEGEDRDTDATIYTYENKLNNLTDYIRNTLKKQDLYLSEVDEHFMDDWKRHLYKIEDFSKAHVGKHLGTIKTVLKFAVTKKYLSHNCLHYYKVPRENYGARPIIYLDEEQLAALENYQFDDPAWQRLMDVCIFQAHTGLAWRDVFELEPGWRTIGIDGKPWIDFMRRKNVRFKKITRVPLDAKAQEILTKYEQDPLCLEKDKCLPVTTNQEMNRKLKVIAELLNKLLKLKLPSDLSTHHFRKTAGMIWINSDVPEETVAQLLGDTVEVVRMHYARVIEKKIARDMAKFEQRKNGS